MSRVLSPLSYGPDGDEGNLRRTSGAREGAGRRGGYDRSKNFPSSRVRLG